jgi:hypothetical protein
MFAARVVSENIKKGFGFWQNGAISATLVYGDMLLFHYCCMESHYCYFK